MLSCRTPEVHSVDNREVVIICPTATEYRAVRDALPTTSERRIHGRTAAVSFLPHSFAVVHAMPAKANCASATQLAVDTFAPSLVLVAGACGSLDDAVPTGSIVCAELCYEVDLIPVEEFDRHAQELTSPTIAVPAGSARRAVLEEYAASLTRREPPQSMHFGNLTSAEANVTDRATRDGLRSRFGAIACDWETAAVARTALLNGVDTMCLRVVTDMAAAKMMEEFRRNRDKCLAALAVAVAELFSAGWTRRLVALETDVIDRVAPPR
jgi:adenosylhomocysteine nucleosidase